MAIAAAAIFVPLGTAWLLLQQAPTPSAAVTESCNAAAIVEFNNLSQNAKDAWLGPALGEMLATEITAGGNVYVLPDELVRTAHGYLAAPLAGGYAAQSLAALRRRLGAEAARVPTRTVPDWLVRTLSTRMPALRELAGLLGAPKTISTARATEVLGWQPRSPEDTIADTGAGLIGRRPTAV